MTRTESRRPWRRLFLAVPGRAAVVADRFAPARTSVIVDPHAANSPSGTSPSAGVRTCSIGSTRAIRVGQSDDSASAILLAD